MSKSLYLLPVDQQPTAALRRELGVGTAAGKRRQLEAVDTKEVDWPDALGRDPHRTPEIVDRREVACVRRGRCLCSWCFDVASGVAGGHISGTNCASARVVGLERATPRQRCALQV